VEHPQRGFVYWTRIPDEPGGKQRPALVVSADVRNRLANDCIVCPISSHVRPAPTHVVLREREGGLPQRSVIKCEQVTTLMKSRLASVPLGGPLSTSRIREVEVAILRALEILVA